MGKRIAILWQRHRLLMIAFAIAATLTLFFALRMVMFALYWADPTHRQQPPEPWMPLRYVAYSWDVPPQELAAALGLGPDARRRLTIADITRITGLSPEEIEARLEALKAGDPKAGEGLERQGHDE